jgi:hypothetical protein
VSENADNLRWVRDVLKALPPNALVARLSLSLLAMRLNVDTSAMKGERSGAPTVTRSHAKEHE